ncbi:hypothetical protein M9458_055242 [Cirrhinus mrigala]|uniref:Uncharacterized protein n=1 Tax=Cirrhinus mrigala TaxID=683832 RepID=A0ABD0MKL9_CIRMR
MKQTWRRPGPQTSGGPPEHESPRRTTAGTTAAPTQKRAEEGPEGDHPAATMQTSQEGVAASPQAPPAAGHTRADRPWARRSKGPPPPSRGPAKPGGPGPAKQPPRSGQRSPEHPAPERETTNAPAAGGILHRQGVRGNQRQTPELNPLHSGVETGRPPRSPAAAEKTTSPDPDRMASSSSQPPAPDREQRTGAPPLPQICPGQGAQAHPDQGPRQPGAAHRTPQQRKNYPHPIIQSTPRLQKTIDTQLKRPPDPPTRQRPPHQGRAQAHAPTHAPGGTPTRTQAPQAQPESQPGGRAAPEPQAPPGPTPEQYGRQTGNLRPPAQASPAAPHAAARKTTPKSHQHPIQARTAAPAPNPPRNPPLGNSQMPPAHMAPPRRQQKPKPDRPVTPTHTR